jgi:DedD protein
MATRSESHDPAVDELRRRARRRLIGAIVLALAAAVLLPLLLENEPKPLGDDVSIQIPPIDSGKFINPLSPGTAPDSKVKSDGGAVSPAPAVETPAAQPPAGNDATAASPNASSPSASGGSPAPASPAPAETKPAAPESQPGASPAPSESTPDAKPASADAKPAAAKTSGAFVVQVAAFSDQYGARSLVIKLKRGGFPGYTEAVATDRGTLHRVRVGPYSSRDVADSARAKLKAAGFDGVVTRNG